MEQIIKFGISNYLQLCVEAGFSQIQSHMLIPASLPDIGQSRWKLFSNIMEALLMNRINLTLKLGH